MSTDPSDNVTRLRKLEEWQRLLDSMQEHIKLECQGPSATGRMAILDSWPHVVKGKDASVTITDEVGTLVGLDFAEPADRHTTETRRTALKLKHSGYNDRHTHPTRPGHKSKGKVKGWQW